MSRKAETEKKIWAVMQAEGMIPKSSTKDGHAAYMQQLRQVQKLVANKDRSVWQFLRDYEVTRRDVINLLSSDIILKDISEVQNDFRRRLGKR